MLYLANSYNFTKVINSNELFFCVFGLNANVWLSKSCDIKLVYKYTKKKTYKRS